MENFLKDVQQGLQSSPKYLLSKYFYDKKGDQLFQQIMRSDDYYLTRCELEIFQEQSGILAEFFKKKLGDFDVWELGAGDATKSWYLLKALQDQQVNFTYFPVDISSNIIEWLQNNLPAKLPGLKIHGMQGEYLAMLDQAHNHAAKPKLVLFLGSNIGNIPLGETGAFLSSIRKRLNLHDILMIGMDLKKNPHIIRRAYNDREGITRQFNLNLLERINRELGGDFNLDNFQHYPSYDPLSGTCKSFLVSLAEQQVKIGGDSFQFEKDECILTEISQKYSIAQTREFARLTGFEPIGHFFDSRNYFLEAVWECV